MSETQLVWDEFHDNVYGFILKRVQNTSDASDILQDVFVKIHTSLHSLKDESKVEAWVYQITRNSINDFYRKAKGESGEEVPDVEDMDVGFYGKQEMFCCLDPFIEELPEKYKEAIKLSDIEGKKQTEIAETLGISYSGVKSRVQRAREILKDKFVEGCNFTINEEGQLEGEQDCPRCNP